MSIYDEAARGALIVLWEASDRVCGKRLKALFADSGVVSPGIPRNASPPFRDDVAQDSDLKSPTISI
nr:hypothetical protein [uncultured Lichenicoccus sp.]